MGRCQEEEGGQENNVKWTPDLGIDVSRLFVTYHREHSDLRATFIPYRNGEVYFVVFRTRTLQEMFAIWEKHRAEGRIDLIPDWVIYTVTWVGKEVRSNGYCAEIDAIPGVVKREVRKDWARRMKFKLGEKNTTLKGQVAEDAMKLMLEAPYYPGLHVFCEALNVKKPPRVLDVQKAQRERNIEGRDFFIYTEPSIVGNGRPLEVEVKGDYRAADTGRLYLQIAEINPDGQH